MGRNRNKESRISYEQVNWKQGTYNRSGRERRQVGKIKVSYRTRSNTEQGKWGAIGTR
jgi:hypothetical protein